MLCSPLLSCSKTEESYAINHNQLFFSQFNFSLVFLGDEGEEMMFGGKSGDGFPTDGLAHVTSK